LCESCHNTAQWYPVTVVDHDDVLGNCIECHNGIITTGKSSDHMPSSDTCEACHLGAGIRWVPVAPNAVDHNHVTGACSSCHNGIIARGKGPDHVVTDLECNACHIPGGAFGADPWADVSGGL
jgi:hypothetical protein